MRAMIIEVSESGKAHGVFKMELAGFTYRYCLTNR